MNGNRALSRLEGLPLCGSVIDGRKLALQEVEGDYVYILPKGGERLYFSYELLELLEGKGYSMEAMDFTELLYRKGFLSERMEATAKSRRDNLLLVVERMDYVDVETGAVSYTREPLFTAKGLRYFVNLLTSGTHD